MHTALSLFNIKYSHTKHYVKLNASYLGIASKKGINDNTNISHSYKYMDRLSFIEEHGKKTEIVMHGDSLIARAEWRDLFPSKDIANYGIDGDTTTGVLGRINLIDKTNPIKVLIMIDINDLLNGKNIVNRQLGTSEKSAEWSYG